MGKMFKGCNELVSLDINHFSTEIVTDMTQMFNSLSSLKKLNLSSFITNGVSKYTDIFNGNNGLEVIINKKNNPGITSNIPDGVTIIEVE